jgi:phosphatidylglycerophosphate synthase
MFFKNHGSRNSNIDGAIKIGIEENLIIWFLYRSTYSLAKLLTKLNISPNSITSLALGLVALNFFLVINGEKFWVVMVVWYLALLLDLLDGQVARLSNRVRKHAFSYDHTSDYIKILIFLASIGISYSSNVLWPLIAFCVGLLHLSDSLNSEISHYENKVHNNKSKMYSKRNSMLLTNIYTVFFSFNIHTLLIFPLLTVNVGVAMIIVCYITFIAVGNSCRFIFLLTRLERYK